MISDVLAEANSAIGRYLDTDADARAYAPFIREITEVLDRMEHLRMRLDEPPCDYRRQTDGVGHE